MLLPQKIKDEIPLYKNNLEKFLSGKLQEDFFRGIRVPWGFYSQRGGRLLMARLRVPGGMLTPRQIHRIGTAANTLADGTLHITTRQDIQIHNLPAERSLDIIETLSEVEISPRGGGGNTIRNITGCYLSGICPHERSEVYKTVWGLTEYLLSCEESLSMPRKIKIAFSGCERDCAYTGINDIGFVALKKGFKVLCGGGMGAKSAVGNILHEAIDHSEVGYVVKAIVNLFIKYGDRKQRHHNRLRFLVQDIGWETFIGHYNRELADVHNQERINLQTDDTMPSGATDISHDTHQVTPGDGSLSSFLKHQVLRQKQDGLSSILLRIPRGEITGDSLIALSRLVDTIPSVHFRTTPRQDMVIANVPQDKIQLVYNTVAGILPVTPSPEALLDMVCCKGATTCNLGICNSVGLASRLNQDLSTPKFDADLLAGTPLNINGCPNACGHHPIGLISFSGMVKKVDNRSVPFYRIYLGGRVNAEKTRLAEPIGSVPARAIPELTAHFFSALGESSSHDTYEYITGPGRKIMERLIGRHASVPLYEEDRRYYMDLGKTELFSLDGLAKGECGSGVIDMIESDLASAEQHLRDGRKKGLDLDDVHRSMIFSSRALLIVSGVDPGDEAEIVDTFIEKFVDTRICSPEFKNLPEVYAGITSRKISRETAYDFADRLFKEVKDAYFRMDSSFNFPVRFTDSPSEQGKPAPSPQVYDLRGSPCPINYVKAKLRLESLTPGERLTFYLDEGEPAESVPRSLERDGQAILKSERENGFYKVTIEKKV